MRAIFSLPPLLVAGAALGGCLHRSPSAACRPELGVGTASDLPFAANVPICRGSASHGARVP